MRLELYGCSYQGPISYSIPQGDKRSYDIPFIDETYDGYNENGTLKSNKIYLCRKGKLNILFFRWSWSIN